MADVFISYARGDGEPAKQLAAELTARGVSVFFDKEVLVAGTDFHKEIAQSLSSAAVVVILLSANTKRSSWVEEELATVIERSDGPTVVPILLDEHGKENWVWPLVSDRQAVDLSNRKLKIRDVASQLTELIPKNGKRPEARASLELNNAPSKLFRLLAYSVLGLIAFLYLIVSPVLYWIFGPTFLFHNLLGSSLPKEFESWIPIIMGILGFVFGYLLRKLRE